MLAELLPPEKADRSRESGITRVWHGWTTPANAPVYENLLRTEIFTGIAARRIPGYRGISLCTRPVGGEVEFATIMWFDSLDAVRAFADVQAVVTGSAGEEFQR